MSFIHLIQFLFAFLTILLPNVRHHAHAFLVIFLLSFFFYFLVLVGLYGTVGVVLVHLASPFLWVSRSICILNFVLVVLCSTILFWHCLYFLQVVSSFWKAGLTNFLFTHTPLPTFVHLFSFLHSSITSSTAFHSQSSQVWTMIHITLSFRYCFCLDKFCTYCIEFRLYNLPSRANCTFSKWLLEMIGRSPSCGWTNINHVCIFLSILYLLDTTFALIIFAGIEIWVQTVFNPIPEPILPLRLTLYYIVGIHNIFIWKIESDLSSYLVEK